MELPADEGDVHKIINFYSHIGSTVEGIDSKTWYRLLIFKEAAMWRCLGKFGMLIPRVIVEARPESLRRQAIQGKTPGSPL